MTGTTGTSNLGHTTDATRRAVACGARATEHVGTARKGLPVTPRTTRVTTSAILAATLLIPQAAHAQLDARAELTTAGANIALGALTASISALIQGNDVSDAMLTGMAGGAIAYSGKRIAAEQFAGAGIAGRAVHAVGASVVRNGGSGIGAWDELAVPFGPVMLHVGPGKASVRVDAMQVAYAAWYGVQERYTVDWQATLSHGVPVFRTRASLGAVSDGAPVGAYHTAGTIRAMAWEPDEILAHETIHAIQRDFLRIAIGGPVDRWLLGQLPGGEFLGRYLDVSVLSTVVHAGLVTAMPNDRTRWMELEAYHLAGPR